MVESRICCSSIVFVLLCVFVGTQQCFLRYKNKRYDSSDCHKIVQFFSPLQSFSRSGEGLFVTLQPTPPSPTEVSDIERRTRRDPDELYAEMRLRLTADLFGPICLAKTPREAMDAWVTAPHPRPNLWQNERVLWSLQKEIKEEIKESGLIVDKLRGYLAALPDGIVGDTSVLKVLATQQPDTLSCVDYVRVDGLSSKNLLYYEIQGLLAVSDRAECILVIISKEVFRKCVVKRDKEFWSTEMVNKLENFCRKTLLPELTINLQPHMDDISMAANIIQAVTTHLQGGGIREIFTKKDGSDTLLLECFYKNRQEWKSKRRRKINFLKRYGKTERVRVPSPADTKERLKWIKPAMDLLSGIEDPWDYNWDKRNAAGVIGSHVTLNNAVEQNKKSEESNFERSTATRFIFLVRHGQYNIQAPFAHMQSLTNKGRNQARKTGERFKKLNLSFKGIIHSTMTRAVETARIIQKYLPDVPMTEYQLIEECFPYLPETPRSNNNWSLDENIIRHNGLVMETAFKKYFHRALPTQTADSYEIMVAHANVIRYFISRALQIPPGTWNRFALFHTSITQIEIKMDGTIRVKSVGETGHLSPF